MPSGGARSRSGPPPDPTALRRERDAGEWTTLPADGRGERPEWPLEGFGDRESDLWEELWDRPQSMMWDRNGSALEVALYARRLAEAEKPESFVGLSTLCRQMADSLGITTPGLRANRWKISRDDVATTPTPGKGLPQARPSARDRLKVVPGGGG